MTTTSNPAPTQATAREALAAQIIEAVRKDGDPAFAHLLAEYDRAVLAATEQPPQETAMQAVERLGRETDAAIKHLNSGDLSDIDPELLIHAQAALYRLGKASQVKEPAPAAGHTPEPVYQLRAPLSDDWLQTPKPPHMPEETHSRWYEVDKAVFDRLSNDPAYKARVLYTSPNVPAYQAQGAGSQPTGAWLMEPNELSHPGLKREVVFDKPVSRPDWVLTPLVRQGGPSPAVRAKAWELTQPQLYKRHNDNRMEELLQALNLSSKEHP